MWVRSTHERSHDQRRRRRQQRARPDGEELRDDPRRGAARRRHELRGLEHRAARRRIGDPLGRGSGRSFLHITGLAPGEAVDGAVVNQGRPEIPKTYDPDEVEPRLYARSLTAGVFHEEPDPARPPFIISMPPPNITGRAHLGHGSTYTPMDVLTRYHRMLGENADWIPGQDHAAIATEAVLVRELAREGLTREGLGRDKYLVRAWQWRDEYGGMIYEQFRTL